MPNWCFNEFRIEIDGDRNDAIEVAKMLSNENTALGRERVAETKSPLSEGEFAFEPLEIFQPPQGMLDANPQELAKVWRNKAYPQHASSTSLREILLARAMAHAQGKENTPAPEDVMEADLSALNIALFGHPTREEFYQSEIGASGGASEGCAHIEEGEDGRFRIVARISSAWSGCDPLASRLPRLSEKIREVRLFWIEEGNGIYGGTLADRLGEPVVIDEHDCMNGYEQACEALELPPPEPEEGEEYVQIDYAIMRAWIESRLAQQAQLRSQPAEPSP